MGLDCLFHVPQFLDSRNVTHVNVSEGGMSVVRDLELLAGLLDDVRDGRIVHVANSGEQVMLNLEVQATLTKVSHLKK